MKVCVKYDNYIIDCTRLFFVENLEHEGSALVFQPSNNIMYVQCIFNSCHGYIRYIRLTSSTVRY